MNNHEYATKFQKACKITFGEIITWSEEFCSNIGAIKISLTTLKQKTRINYSVMNEVIKTLRASLKPDEPKIFHLLLLDWVGNIFQKEFLHVVDQELNN